MKIKNVFAVAMLLCSSVFATGFNLAEDYSSASNPNGTWTYGWNLSTEPPGSGLWPLEWNGSAWAEASGVSIWKNESESTIDGVAPGQVALHNSGTANAILRWTAPEEIGLATLLIEGQMPLSETGIEIRRGSGITLTVTNSSSFTIRQMVEPGEKIDFVALAGYGSGTKPLDLTITTIETNLQLTTFSDFNHSYMISWGDIPAWQFMRTVDEGGTNRYATFYDDGIEWAAGGFQDMPFAVSTNAGLSTFRYFSKLGPGGSYYKDFGSSGLAFAYDSIVSSSADTSFAFQFKLNAYQQGVNYPHMVTYDGEGTGTNFTSAFPVNTWIEFRADIDWSHQDDEGKYGLFSLFSREGTGFWQPVAELQGVEMKIEDPSLITRLCAIVDASEDGYSPYLDDIRYSNGENPSLGAGTNLLVNGSIDAYQLGWRLDDLQNMREASYYQQVVKLGFPEGSTGRVSQVVSLLGQGFAANDIDAGLYRAAFGGWLNNGGGDAFCGPYAGRVGIDFLDSTNGLISSADTPDYSEVSGWQEIMATNQVPVQTRFIRYNYYSQNGMLNNATLSVLGLPQEDVSLLVASGYGSPTPAVGTTSNAWGTVVTCSVANVTSGTTQYECTGWTGTGSVPASGSSNSVVVTLEEDSSITWNWRTNYWLEVSVSGSGSVNHSSGWYAKDEVLELEQFPTPGWLFMGWSGDASGTNQVILSVDAPKAVTAIFSDDADGDGLTNSEEEALGSNPWKTDTDDDGFGDKLEVDHNWNPAVSDQWAVDYISTNGAAFGLYASNAVLDVAVGQVALGIDGTTARLRLQVEKSEDLVTWTNAGDVLEWTLPVGGEKQFLRVRSAANE